MLKKCGDENRPHGASKFDEKVYPVRYRIKRMIGKNTAILENLDDPTIALTIREKTGCEQSC